MDKENRSYALTSMSVSSLIKHKHGIIHLEDIKEELTLALLFLHHIFSNLYACLFHLSIVTILCSHNCCQVTLGFPQMLVVHNFNNAELKTIVVVL